MIVSVASVTEAAATGNRMLGRDRGATASTPSVIERPVCPNCKTRMLLQHIAPGPPGFDHRLFECVKCAYVENVIVPDDPMNSRVQGWLRGELRAPT